MKNLSIRKLVHFSLFFLTFVFSACNLSYNSPLKEYLKDYTETAAIVKLDLPESGFPVDKEGYISIPSSDDFPLTFTMRNPQMYVLDFSLNLDDSGAAKIAEKFNETAYSFTQSDDLLYVTLNFTQDYLYELECGGNLSAEVNLTEPRSNRNFEPYQYSLRVNTPPEPVRNLVVLQDYSTNKYVLAMNMPDMSGIHKDIKVLKIDDKQFPVTLGAAPSENDTGIDVSGTSAFSTVYNPVWIAGISGSEFEGAESKRVIYYKTNTAISAKEIFFNIALEDSKGLSVESKVSERSKKLEKVIFSEGYNELETDEDGYAHFTVSASPFCTDGSSSGGGVSVYYTIYAFDESAPDHKGAVKKQGAGIDSVTVSLTNGKWICESWAHKSGYIDSTVNTGELSVQGFVFIDPDYTGEIRDGGKATPFKSVEEAFAEVVGVDTVKMYLLNDVALQAPLTLTKHMEVKSADGFKLSGKITVPDNYVLTINDKAVLDYVYLKEGGLIRTRKIAAGVNPICSVEYVPEVAGSSLEGIIVIEDADSAELTEAILNRFILKNAGYFIEPENGKGVIAIAGITLEVQTIFGNYSLKVEGFRTSGGMASASAGTKLSVTEIKDSSGEEVSLSAVTAMNVYVEGSLVQTNAAQTKKTELTIGMYEYGGTYEYVLEVCFTIWGIPVSAQIPFYL